MLISNNTPWKDLATHGAGYSIPLEELVWTKTLLEMLDWDENDFKKACSSALTYYQLKFDFERLKSDYISMFTSNG